MPAAPRIKFCGLTNVDDARLAVQAGAWALGMIFWPGSPRRCELPEAARIARDHGALVHCDAVSSTRRRSTR